ncbi:MAG: hypothetical protein LBF41_05335 [Deltaproteobacteria bacterium]|jgi:hypothetical protein|nr:hypothetical protein [Deltaproteobacteria bacterium]
MYIISYVKLKHANNNALAAFVCSLSGLWPTFLKGLDPFEILSAFGVVGETVESSFVRVVFFFGGNAMTENSHSTRHSFEVVTEAAPVIARAGKERFDEAIVPKTTGFPSMIDSSDRKTTFSE